MRAALDIGLDAQSKPAHVGWMFELLVARAEAEIAWCERVAARIEAGASYLPAEMADVRAGRAGETAVRRAVGRRVIIKVD